MKVLKLCLLATILTLTLSLLLSCGDGADGLHGDGCTCDECLNGKNNGTEGDNDPEKGDTPLTMAESRRRMRRTSPIKSLTLTTGLLLDSKTNQALLTPAT